ncbi:hypothetical protein CAPTEDRAFT_219651 [Capitella teleta]|uniref:Uncharacterized protein n=1 Tax=Capitella teleta TaxID=283909 RepID=R7TVG2_CAPTE|nr:hypothetical protein CAPTEDRAFT_219651 [Capitella teleta]|eukprot:ELT97709.1 hypothetical protein CAPTEDRAFT_219651 [Capitella teleta]
MELAASEKRLNRLMGEQLESDNDHPLGQLLVKGDGVHMSSADLNIKCMNGQASFFEDGVIFRADHIGYISIPKASLVSINFYDGNSSNIVALLIVEYQETFTEHLPYFLHNHQHHLVFAFQPKTKIYKALFSDLRYELVWVFVIRSFMQHLAVSSVGRSSIPEDSFSVVLDGTVNENVVDGAKQELIVTVLAGVPGCHKEKLCKLLTGLSKEENRWVIIHPMPDFPETFNAPRIQASLKAAWQAHYSRRKSARTPRALLIIPGYTDPVEAVQVVLNHPDPELAPKLKIGAVTVCIDPNNAFMSGHYTLPKLLDMCHEGWVNNILLTHDSKQNSETEVLQHLMRCTNPNVAFVVAPRAHLSRSPDIDLVLSESAFNHPDLMRARFLSNPGWWNGSSKADSCFPQIKSCILRFTHSVHDFKYTVLSDHLSLQPVEQNSAEAGYYVTFYGCQLSEDTLKNWLRQCAPKIPEKKVHRVRTSLTKAEVKRVHEAHHLDALPEGWFYNGSMFLSLLGEKSHVHPDLERHLEAYLEDVNAQVDAFNAKIDKTPAKDIFDP